MRVRREYHRRHGQARHPSPAAKQDGPHRVWADRTGQPTDPRLGRAVPNEHARTVEGIVRHGALLNQGKAALGHGNWTKALEAAGIHVRTAEMYMRIANQSWANPKNYAVLPSTVSALDYLAGLQEAFVQDLLDEKKLNLNLTKKELVEMVEPTPAEPTPKKRSKSRTPKGLTWPTSVDMTVTTFFGAAFECDTTNPDEVVWRRDDESIAFTAPRTDSNGFHNRIASALVLFPLGQSFAMFYEGERRDEFAAAFGDLGTLVVAWSG
jgi:hypothetical protein